MQWLQIYYKKHALPYLISEFGEVISLQHVKFLKILKPEKDKDGYLKISLRIKKHKSKKFFVHRLVAMMFCEGYDEDLVVNHIDGNIRNNHYSNLEWVTRKENEEHAARNYLKANGERNSKCVHSNELVHGICVLLDEGYSIGDVAKQMNVSYYYVYEIANCSVRREISKDYNFYKKNQRLSKKSNVLTLTLGVESE